MSDSLIPDGFQTGLLPRDFDKNPLGSLTFAAPFPRDALVPLSEILPRIKAKEAAESTLLHVWKRKVNTVLDQNGFGYCHAFSPAMMIMVLRAAQGLGHTLLSASSIGGPVTGFQNQGAYIFNDLKQIVNFGIAPVEYDGKVIYPMTTTKNHWTPEAQRLAKLNIVEEYWEGDNSDNHAVISCLLTDKPVCVGYNWWGHAVTLLWVTVVNNVLYVIGINSWKNTWSKLMETVPNFQQMLGGGFFCFPIGKVSGNSVTFGRPGQWQGTPHEWYCGKAIKASSLAV